MATPTTENPSFEVISDNPPFDFPAYETTGHKTYLEYQEGDEHPGSGHMSEKRPKNRHTTEAKDALDGIARNPWLDSIWAKVLVWLLIVAVIYRIYLHATAE